MSIHSAPHRAIHLLALAPISPQNMSQKTKIPLPEVENLLKEYGKKLSDDLYTLADSRYKDLRVWEWRYSPSQRAYVIDEATKVFDSLNIPADHAYRRNLIDPKIKKAEADAAAAEKEAKRRALADAEAAEKLAADRAASERLAAERAAEAKQKQGQSTNVTRRAPAVSSPNGYSSSTGMLQKVTKLGTTKKSRSASSSSSSSTETKPAKHADGKAAARQLPLSPTKRNESDDGYSSPNGPITSSSRGRLKATATTARTKSTSPNPPSRLGKPSPVPSPVLGAVGGTSSPVSAIAKKRKLPSSRSSTPTSASTPPSNGVSIRTKRVAVGVQSPVPMPAPPAPAATSTFATSASAANKVPSPPRPPRAGPDEDMFALAQMFRQKYSIYEKLYRNVSGGGGDDTDDQKRLRKLISLHRELENVKKRLWAVSPPGDRGTSTKKTLASSTGGGSSSGIKNSSRLR